MKDLISLGHEAQTLRSRGLKNNYPNTFKVNAVNLAETCGFRKVSRALGIAISTLYSWRKNLTGNPKEHEKPPQFVELSPPLKSPMLEAKKYTLKFTDPSGGQLTMEWDGKMCETILNKLAKTLFQGGY